MAGRLVNLIKLDGKLLWRNKFIHISLVIALIFIILVNFLIPKEFKVGVAEYILDDTHGKIFADFLQEEINPKYIMHSESELLKRVQNDLNSVGIILRGSKDNPQAIIIQQGHENPKSIELLKVSIEQLWVQNGEIFRPSNHYTNYLFSRTSETTFNLSLLPLFIALESVILGFYFAAVMAYQEKEEGTIKSYRISPGGTIEYILSKTIVNVVLSLLSALIIVVGTVGLKVQYGKLIILIIISAAILALLGLGIGALLKNLSSFIYPALIVVTIMALPIAAYLFPAFNAWFIRYITTYPVMFGLKEILFPIGRMDFYSSIFGVLIIQLFISLLFAYATVKTHLMQEVS